MTYDPGYYQVSAKWYHETTDELSRAKKLIALYEKKIELLNKLIKITEQEKSTVVEDLLAISNN